MEKILMAALRERDELTAALATSSPEFRRLQAVERLIAAYPKRQTVRRDRYGHLTRAVIGLMEDGLARTDREIREQTVGLATNRGGIYALLEKLARRGLLARLPGRPVKWIKREALGEHCSSAPRGAAHCPDDADGKQGGESDGTDQG